MQHLTAMEWVYAQSSLLRTRMLRLRLRVVCLRVGWGVTWRARTQGVGSPTSRHILSPDDPVLRHKSNQEKKNTHTRSKSHKCLNLYTNIFFPPPLCAVLIFYDNATMCSLSRFLSISSQC